jgi:hypothetical protein
MKPCFRDEHQTVVEVVQISRIIQLFIAFP